MDLPSFEFGTVHSKFKGFQYQNTKSEAPDSTEFGQCCTGWWQKLLTFCSGRFGVNYLLNAI
jgi:hypothetical protein